LSSATANPTAAHVHGFGPTLSDGVIGNAIRGAVVGLNTCWTLREAHFVKCDSDGFSIFAAVEETGKLAFGGRGHDLLEFACGRQNRTMHQMSEFSKGVFGCSKELEHFIAAVEDQGTTIHKQCVVDCCLVCCSSLKVGCSDELSSCENVICFRGQLEWCGSPLVLALLFKSLGKGLHQEQEWQGCHVVTLPHSN